MEQTQTCCSQLREGQREGAEEERNRETVVGQTQTCFSQEEGLEEGAEDAREKETSPVHWKPIRRLQSSKYINYKELIMEERTPDLFKGTQNLPVFIGAMYVLIEDPKDSQGPPERLVYFEASDPDKPVMRVPKKRDEYKVASFYSWDRINFVYQDLHPNDTAKYTFRIFTPANLGTYGIVADLEEPEGVPIFAPLPKGKTVEYFPYFQIRTGQKWGNITNKEETHGLYVDKTDGWKVMIADKKSHPWAKFSIKPFKHHSSTHSTGLCEGIPSDS